MKGEIGVSSRMAESSESTMQPGYSYDAVCYTFTGKERDSESGLDEFGARYYASSLGRFMTPDWAAKPVTVPCAKFGDPHSLNLYSYVENGPVNRIDPDGHDADEGGGGVASDNSGSQSGLLGG